MASARKRPSLLSDSRVARKRPSVLSEGPFLDNGFSESDGSPSSRRLSLVERPVASRQSTMQTKDVDPKKMRQSIKATIELEKLQEEKRLSRTLPHYKRVSRCLVKHPVVTFLTTLLTVYALMGDDTRLMLTSLPADIVFDVLTLSAIIIFSLEIVISCLGKQDYMNGFFFWLDLIATVTLVLDITVVNDFLFQSSEETLDISNSRTAKIGARATRMVRILRLVRIVKLYKAIQEAKRKPDNDDDWEDEDAEEENDPTSESNLGKKLSDMTTRRVVILILMMMLVYPLLAPTSENYPGAASFAADTVEQAFSEYEQDSSQRWRYENALLYTIYSANWYTNYQNPSCSGYLGICPSTFARHIYWVGITGSDEAICEAKADESRMRAETVANFNKEVLESDPYLYYSMGGMPESVQSILSSPWNKVCRSNTGTIRVGMSLIGHSTPADYPIECPEDLRKIESDYESGKLMTASRWEQWHYTFVYDNRAIVKEEAFFGIWTTVFTCVLLCVASLMFSADAQELVVQPVEMMMLKVQMIRVNPLIAAKLNDEAFKREEIQKAKSLHKGKLSRLKRLNDLLFCVRRSTEAKKPMETAILEQTVIKLGTLLALGFGSAGMNIISQNMQGLDSAGVDAMIAGTTVECVIGYARLGDFGTFTEVLQSKVMTFVNQVAEIIHGMVDAFHGAPSRNNGDTFLAVWFNEEQSRLTKLADMAVMACAMVLAGVSRSATLAAYRTHPGLQQRLRGTDCRVTLSWGFHHGWAIEGALGTEFKIDATYVSPNVSVCENVQSAAEIYGTSVLMTGGMHNTLSPGMASNCRLIDQVKIRGSLQPMHLYTVDMNDRVLPIDTKALEVRWNTRMQFRTRRFLENEKKDRLSDEYCVSEHFSAHPDVVLMRKAYTVDFREVFSMAYQNYAQGEWRAAQRLLRTAMSILLTTSGMEDGPSAALLRYMQQFGGNAPPEWKGVHPLEDMPSAERRSSGVTHVPRPGTKMIPSPKGMLDFAEEIALEEPARIGLRLR